MSYMSKREKAPQYEKSYRGVIFVDLAVDFERSTIYVDFIRHNEYVIQTKLRTWVHIQNQNYEMRAY